MDLKKSINIQLIICESTHRCNAHMSTDLSDMCLFYVIIRLHYTGIHKSRPDIFKFISDYILRLQHNILELSLCILCEHFHCKYNTGPN